ncbi:rifin [Plasmodium falciparum IGH-CR14]|uniref:Rifin n=1 Tax=Plasmodium falciparum IGH-CR14 TaxID=580059 RepID=A0A0L1I3P9_PLAFA|nr:rifin [Plasmodium falciparum IGH-CR14]
MKVHYINILLFSLPLNILIYNQRNHNSTTPHTPKIPTTRSLCECELYELANYDSDPEMKRVMQQFEDRTTQRFHEYDEKMQSKRIQCKERCDKEIQKIILKDKLEKELMDKFATLQTDIQSDAIPICVCEKSIADKVEKGCLRCVGVFGGGVMPGFGTIGGTALYALNQLKPAVFKAAIKAALEEGAAEISAAGIEAGDAAGIHLQNGSTYGTPANIAIPQRFGELLKRADVASDAAAKIAREGATNAIKAQETALIEGGFNNSITSIYVSIIAIAVIVLIMVIIYLILRYRRKKKMKKKLQYIKLLEE